MKIIIIFVIFVLVLLIISYANEYKKKKEMGTLTGAYYHKKSHEESIPYYIMVQHVDEKGNKYFRLATSKEVITLKKWKYLK